MRILILVSPNLMRRLGKLANLSNLGLPALPGGYQVDRGHGS